MKFEQWWMSLPGDLRRAYADGGVHACQVAFNAGRDAAQANEKDREDAERYRWLRKNWQYSLHSKPVWIDIDPDLEPPIDSTTKLDELIDAARAAAKEQE